MTDNYSGYGPGDRPKTEQVDIKTFIIESPSGAIHSVNADRIVVDNGVRLLKKGHRIMAIIPNDYFVFEQ